METDSFTVIEVFDPITGQYFHHSDWPTREAAIHYADQNREDTWLKWRIVTTTEHTI